MSSSSDASNDLNPNPETVENYDFNDDIIEFPLSESFYTVFE